MYTADYHMHSTCSPDGKMTMSQAAEAAIRAGLDEICITDHVDTIYWGSNEPRDSFDWDASMTQYLEAVDKFLAAHPEQKLHAPKIPAPKASSKKAKGSKK